jgi:hypothetical protein
VQPHGVDARHKAGHDPHRDLLTPYLRAYAIGNLDPPEGFSSQS